MRYKTITLIGVLGILLISKVAAEDPPGSHISADSSIGQILLGLAENQWVQLNTNTFQSVWTPLELRPDPPRGYTVDPIQNAPERVLASWSSVAWDRNRGDIILWGGGHFSYAGNEVYRWRSSSLQWERASLPSDVITLETTGSLYFVAVDGADNAPTSSHTYDNSEFLPIVDRFVTFGGASFNEGGFFRDPAEDHRRTGPYFWDPSKADGNKIGGTTGSGVDFSIEGGGMWQNRDNIDGTTATPGSRWFLDGATAYAEENGKDVLYVQTYLDLHRYVVNDPDDPLQDTYERVGTMGNIIFTGEGVGAYAPQRKLFLRTASQYNYTNNPNANFFGYWLVDDDSLAQGGGRNKAVVFEPVVADGEVFDFKTLGDYGMDYDPVRDVFVLWVGTRELWALIPPDDLQTGEWVLKKLRDNTGTGPTRDDPVFTGVLGKWKYIQELGVFIGIEDNKRDGNVWAYKP